MKAKKVLLVGNFGVGKTSLIKRYVLNDFSEKYISTIGVRVSAKEVEIEGETVKLLIWDVSGTIGKEKIPKSYFLGANAAMYVFDLSREETYEHLDANLAMAKEVSGLQEVVLVGNKKDLVSEEEMSEIQNSVEANIDYFTSAKESQNVEEAFYQLARTALNL